MQIAYNTGKNPNAYYHVAAPALRMDAYEGGRPSAEAACRIGDERFLPSALPHPSVGETA